jgi:exopolysaccharide production protein ExoQ
MENNKVANFRKGILIGLFFFLTLYHAISIFGIRGIDCPSNWLTLTGACILTKSLYLEMMLWVAAILLMVLELKWGHGFQKFLHFCVSNWPVFVFVLLAVVSLIWSILLGAALSKVFVLIAATFAGIYFGSQFRISKILQILSWMFIIICVGSLFFIFFLPDLGVMSFEIYGGAWAGIFWHRNYLGCIMALGMAVFLINLLSLRKPIRFQFFLNLVFFFVAAFLIFKSKSATGTITAVVLLFVTILIYVWTLIRQKLRIKHYLIFLGVLLIGVVAVLLNLNFLLGILGRNTSLTGRIPMWTYLFNNFISHRLILGYGYGSFWHLEGIRVGIAQVLDWSYPVLIGDNGFVDILVNLGVVGLVIFIGLMTTGIYFAVKKLLQKRTLISAFPLIYFVFFLVANISLSLILESESFTWFLGVALVVSIRSLKDESIPAETKRGIKKGELSE